MNAALTSLRGSAAIAVAAGTIAHYHHFLLRCCQAVDGNSNTGFTLYINFLFLHYAQ